VRNRAALALALALLLLPAPAAAAFTVRSEVDARRVGVQDQVQLTITLEGSGAPEDVPLPRLTNLDVLGGPFQSTQVSIVNGRMSQSRTLTFVLKPRAEGSAEIGPVQAGEQTAPAIALEVVAGSVRPRSRHQRPDPFGSDPFAGAFGSDPFEEVFGRPRGRAGEPKLLMEAVPSRTRLRVGEPLVITYALDTQVSVADLQLKDAPQYAGFWVEDLERPAAGANGEAVTIGGESYRRFPLIRKLLFPTKAGVLTLPAASFRINLARQGFFDAGGVVERATKPVTITVDPLPEAPGFAGAVGRFSATAALDHDTVPLGEAATLRFRVEGTGNLKWIEQGPKVEAPGAKVYPPQVKSELRATAEGIAGSRTWEFVVVPQTTGRVDVAPLAFSYFDTGAGRIVTAQTPPLSLQVEGGTGAANLPPPPVPAAGTAQRAGGLPLRSGLDLPGPRGAGLSARLLALLIALALLAHAALLVAKRFQAFVPGSRTSGGRSRSARAALRDLARAGGDGLSKEQAAALVEKALHEAFGELDERDESERARAVRALLDDVRFVRYAPQLGDYSQKIRELAARGAETVRRWA
jgi:hypothetical protein